jgi:pyruvate dehydrogenase E1 component
MEGLFFYAVILVIMGVLGWLRRVQENKAERDRMNEPRTPAHELPPETRRQLYGEGHTVREATPARQQSQSGRTSTRPGQPGDRAAHQEHHPLERDGDGRAGEPRSPSGIGGHISTYASAATLYEVGFNHFFRGPDHRRRRPGLLPGPRLAGHLRAGVPRRPADRDSSSTTSAASWPGRRAVVYPHPWLMPDFWQFPTVSMGLGPIMAIYQARFNRYLEDRGLKDTGRQKVWASWATARCDEPETLGAITLAAREKLDNLIFVINCNLQRLDGPVRGNGKIIQELEAIFRGAGWNVIKVIWGSDWDPLLAKGHDGAAGARMGEVVDGEYQKYTVEPGRLHPRALLRQATPAARMVEHSPTSSSRLRRGGHDPEKVYAAYKAAVEHQGRADGDPRQDDQGLRPGRGGRRPQHHPPAEEAQRGGAARVPDRFGIPISDEECRRGAVLPPPEDSPEMQYLRERAKALGGLRAERAPATAEPLPIAAAGDLRGVPRGHRTAARSRRRWAFVRLLSQAAQGQEIGKLHRARSCPTRRAPSAWRRCSARSASTRTPASSTSRSTDSLLYYKEAKDGQILEEGITEAGSMSSFIAAAPLRHARAST